MRKHSISQADTIDIDLVNETLRSEGAKTMPTMTTFPTSFHSRFRRPVPIHDEELRTGISSSSTIRDFFDDIKLPTEKRADASDRKPSYVMEKYLACDKDKDSFSMSELEDKPSMSQIPTANVDCEKYFPTSMRCRMERTLKK